MHVLGEDSQIVGVRAKDAEDRGRWRRICCGDSYEKIGEAERGRRRAPSRYVL